jgi:hypothetical protein
MLSLFTLLIWVPAVIAEPKTRLQWTALFISWAFTSAAWLIAESGSIDNYVNSEPESSK